jgi:hypothetical protein
VVHVQGHGSPFRISFTNTAFTFTPNASFEKRVVTQDYFVGERVEASRRSCARGAQQGPAGMSQTDQTACGGYFTCYTQRSDAKQVKCTGWAQSGNERNVLMSREMAQMSGGRTSAAARSGWNDYLKERDEVQQLGTPPRGPFSPWCPQVLPFERQSRALIGTGA